MNGVGICALGGTVALLAALALGPFGLPLGWLAVGAVWGSLYNRIYTARLLSRGYRLADTDERNAQAQRALGLDVSATAPRAG
ncbi:hypothetical protein J2858_003335 [Neorhizobium galegae]|uniref:hypothetical protein n=1 Tax=Rhizobium sp. SGZ-381 TaxID=3342800 RepID=UPI00366D6DA3|nr:hypothetical protein [Neorhizobium galegae]